MSSSNSGNAEDPDDQKENEGTRGPTVTNHGDAQGDVHSLGARGGATVVQAISSAGAANAVEMGFATYAQWCAASGRDVPVDQDKLKLSGSPFTAAQGEELCKRVASQLARAGHRVSFFGQGRGATFTRFRFACECHGKPTSTGVGTHCNFRGSLLLSDGTLSFSPSNPLTAPSEIGVTRSCTTTLSATRTPCAT